MANTIKGFLERFPDDDACLAHLFRVRYGDTPDCPKCKRDTTFHKLTGFPAYSCAHCGHHIHPTAGTFMHRSHISIRDWFYAMYLFTTSRHGVPAKELERQLGVSYPTALRVAHKIREYMGLVDGDDPLSGHVEIDETMVGGYRPGPRGRGAAGKTTVLGMVERGGDVITRIVPNVRRNTLEPHIFEHVAGGTIVSTDDLTSYDRLGRRFAHSRVNHKAKEWVRGNVHTNTVEGFWSLFKRAICGTHVHISTKHMPKYLAEFEFRYNMRKSPHLMFPALLFAFQGPASRGVE